MEDVSYKFSMQLPNITKKQDETITFNMYTINMSGDYNYTYEYNDFSKDGNEGALLKIF